eukprot:900492-Prymnesium_polylepis.1
MLKAGLTDGERKQLELAVARVDAICIEMYRRAKEPMERAAAYRCAQLEEKSSSRELSGKGLWARTKELVKGTSRKFSRGQLEPRPSVAARTKRALLLRCATPSDRLCSATGCALLASPGCAAPHLPTGGALLASRACGRPAEGARP